MLTLAQIKRVKFGEYLTQVDLTAINNLPYTSKGKFEFARQKAWEYHQYRLETDASYSDSFLASSMKGN